MAQKKPNLKLTPLMALAVLTLFILMIPIFTIVTRNYRVGQAQATQVQVPLQ